MRRPILLVALSLILSGCFGDSSNSTSSSDASPQTIADLEERGLLPKLDRSKDLKGPDENGDGVRDDIGRYIEANYSGSDEKKAARQFARSARKVFDVELSDLPAVKRVNQEMTNAIICARHSFKESDNDTSGLRVTEEIEALNANTRSRTKRYLEFAKALDGTTWSLPKGDGCND